MYKITWSEKSDRHIKNITLVPDADSLFALYWVLTGYGRGDGCQPLEISGHQPRRRCDRHETRHGRSKSDWDNREV